MRHTANVVETAAAAASEAKAVGGGSAVPVKPPAAPMVVRPDVFSYSAAITACGNCGEWRRALALLQVMREQGVPPNVRFLEKIQSGIFKISGVNLGRSGALRSRASAGRTMPFVLVISSEFGRTALLAATLCCSNKFRFTI